MKIKSVVKYSLNSAINAYLIFAAIIIALIHIAVIISGFTVSNGHIGGIDFATMIFMLVIGISNYRENLLMSVQNGISRRTYFYGTAIMFLILALIGSAGDMLINVIGNFYESHMDNMFFDSNYEQFFMKGSDNIIPAFSDYLKEFVMHIAIYTAALSGGLLVGSAFYRLNKVMKFIIPAAFYLLVFVIFPLIDLLIFDMKITYKFIKLGSWVFKSCWNMSITFIAGALILLAVSLPFIRRVSINDRK